MGKNGFFKVWLYFLWVLLKYPTNCFLCFNIKNAITFSVIFNNIGWVQSYVQENIFLWQKLWNEPKSKCYDFVTSSVTNKKWDFVRTSKPFQLRDPRTFPSTFVRMFGRPSPWIPVSIFQIFWQSRFMSCTNSLNWIHMPSYKRND